GWAVHPPADRDPPAADGARGDARWGAVRGSGCRVVGVAPRERDHLDVHAEPDRVAVRGLPGDWTASGADASAADLADDFVLGAVAGVLRATGSLVGHRADPRWGDLDRVVAASYHDRLQIADDWRQPRGSPSRRHLGRTRGGAGNGLIRRDRGSGRE